MGGRLVAISTISLPPSPGLRELSDEAAVPGRAWLNQMAVHPDVRGTGLPRRPWETGRTWAAGQGTTSVCVDTAAPAEPLVAIYRVWGFEPTGTIHWEGKRYDSVVMVRLTVE
ncbi:hypothetical protein KZX06_06390 [Micrococcus sp. EYE_162]|nr:hypothetical protein [Micrococcus sp. EYE_212]MCK6171662.1 hypothetical protein [Micrococcus sp. EYE_162]